MTLEGYDISHWQATTPNLDRVSFVIVKATEGKNIADSMYTTHSRNVLRAGKHLGSYHFVRQGDPIDEQARWYIAHTANAEALAVDNEGGHAMTWQGIKALIAAIRKYDPLHRKVGLYMSRWPYMHGGYSQSGQDFEWIADYDAVPAVDWEIWQYSGTTLDKDRARDQATIDRIFGGNITPAPHFAAAVTKPTALWNDMKHRWAWNVRPIKVGTKLVIRGAKFLKGGQVCYPIVGPLYAGYYVPVKNVAVGAKLP